MGSSHRDINRALLLIAAAMAAFLLCWLWYVGHDRPLIKQSPHSLAPVILNQLAGQKLVPFYPVPSFNLFVKAAKAAVGLFGFSYRSLALAQLPLALLLLASVAAIAWRLGGPVAGATAAWVGAFSPATFGAALQLDDLLAVQACTASALAVVVWMEDRRWFGLFVALPILLLWHTAHLFSSALACCAVICIGVACFLAQRLFTDFSPALLPKRLWANIGIIIGLAAVFVGMIIWPNASSAISYVGGQVDQGTAQSVFSSPAILMSYPANWFFLQAGWLPATACLALLAVVLVKRKAGPLLPLIGWLLLPMLLFGLVPKRNPNYLLAVAPATYPLMAVALRQLLPGRKQALAGLALTALSLTTWLAIMAHPDYYNENLVRIPFQDMQGFRDNLPSPLLISPYVELTPAERIERHFARHCAPDDQPVLFAPSLGNSEEIGFLLLYRHPQMKAVPLFAHRIPPLENACIIGPFPPATMPPPTFDQAAPTFIEHVMDIEISYQDPEQFKPVFLTERRQWLIDHGRVLGLAYYDEPVNVAIYSSSVSK